ncbi:response regulator [Paenibacillus thalictri]|uniref:Response regulator n=1 Tax=Paenibacillus thalictri TaxID=2527873 RepID=A0A4Q9DLP7_9BACL|nr:response regulator [Paenibacillus thalictri]TBL75350.1 response regulator [Paenibacillus thalictri]
MYKVIIVEDEWLVREGLKTTIAWEQIGCELAGEAEDGMEALELIGREHFDIVLSDIRMPALDGIGLAERLSTEYPHIKVVFLTGYDDFIYAQKAVKLGAADFVLKPTNPDELIEVLAGVVSKLDDERSRLKQAERLELRLVLGQPIIMGKMLQDMMLDYAGERETELFREYCAQGDGELREFRIVLLQAHDKASPMSGHAEVIRRIEEEVALISSFPLVRMGEARYAILADKVTERAGLELFWERLAWLRSSVAAIGAGISGKRTGTENVSGAYREALNAMYGTMITGGLKLNWHEDMEERSLRTVSDIWLELDMVHLIKTGLPEDIRTRARQWHAQWVPEALDGPERLSRFFEGVTALYALLLQDEEFQQIGLDAPLLLSPLHQTESAEPHLQRFEDLLLELNQRYVQQHHSKPPTGFESIEAYIKEHYGEEITLQDMARKHHMSESYFSRLFKQQVGVSFMEYLTGERVRHAVELLANPRLKIYEVSLQVGYQDSRYFSQIYRKYTGETPTEYRKRLGIVNLPL